MPTNGPFAYDGVISAVEKCECCAQSGTETSGGSGSSSGSSSAPMSIEDAFGNSGSDLSVTSYSMLGYLDVSFSGMGDSNLSQGILPSSGSLRIVWLDSMGSSTVYDYPFSSAEYVDDGMVQSIRFTTELSNLPGSSGHAIGAVTIDGSSYGPPEAFHDASVS